MKINTKYDIGDVVIDPCRGSTLRAVRDLRRSSYGFEITKEMYNKAKNEMLKIEKYEVVNELF